MGRERVRANLRGLISARQAKRSGDGLSIGEVVRQYGDRGVTFDKLRYWDKLGLLVPTRVGARRIYTQQDLEEQLHRILSLTEDGLRPGKIATILEYEGLSAPPSVSDTKSLDEQLRRAVRGDVVRVPLMSKRHYNTTYRRIERKAKALGKTVGRGREVEIRLSEDERYLEVHFNR